jgi:competence protein ComGC
MDSKLLDSFTGRKPLMKKQKRNWRLTMVDVMVGLAVLMILSALVVPFFVKPECKAVSGTTAASAPVKPARH